MVTGWSKACQREEDAALLHLCCLGGGLRAGCPVLSWWGAVLHRFDSNASASSSSNDGDSDREEKKRKQLKKAKMAKDRKSRKKPLEVRIPPGSGGRLSSFHPPAVPP